MLNFCVSKKGLLHLPLRAPKKEETNYPYASSCLLVPVLHVIILVARRMEYFLPSA